MHSERANETAWLRSLVERMVDSQGGSQVLARLEKIMADLTALTASVTNITVQSDAIVALVEGMAEQLRQVATDPAAIKALADQLDKEAGDLAAAVAANTPTPVPPVE